MFVLRYSVKKVEAPPVSTIRSSILFQIFETSRSTNGSMSVNAFALKIRLSNCSLNLQVKKQKYLEDPHF